MTKCHSGIKVCVNRCGHFVRHMRHRCLSGRLNWICMDLRYLRCSCILGFSSGLQYQRNVNRFCRILGVPIARFLSFRWTKDANVMAYLSAPAQELSVALTQWTGITCVCYHRQCSSFTYCILYCRVLKRPHPHPRYNNIFIYIWNRTYWPKSEPSERLTAWLRALKMFVGPY